MATALPSAAQLRQPVADDVRVLHHVEELVGDGGVEAAECLRHARVEAWRDEHEAAALAGLLTEGEAERSRREGVDVDVGLRVRPGRVREGNLEAVLLVVGERDIGGRGDLLDVVGIAVAVVVVQRRSVGPGGDVVDDRASADVRRRFRRLERVRAAARRSLDDRSGCERGMGPRSECEAGDERERKGETAARHPDKVSAGAVLAESLDRVTSARQRALERLRPRRARGRPARAEPRAAPRRADRPRRARREAPPPASPCALNG